MSVFSDVWVYSGAAFVIGILLTWAFWVRPLQKRLAAARREASERRPEPTRQPTMFEPMLGELAPQRDTAPMGATSAGVTTLLPPVAQHGTGDLAVADEPASPEAEEPLSFQTYHANQGPAQPELDSGDPAEDRVDDHSDHSGDRFDHDDYVDDPADGSVDDHATEYFEHLRGQRDGEITDAEGAADSWDSEGHSGDLFEPYRREPDADGEVEPDLDHHADHDVDVDDVEVDREQYEDDLGVLADAEPGGPGAADEDTAARARGTVLLRDEYPQADNEVPAIPNVEDDDFAAFAPSIAAGTVEQNGSVDRHEMDGPDTAEAFADDSGSEGDAPARSLFEPVINADGPDNDDLPDPRRPARQPAGSRPDEPAVDEDDAVDGSVTEPGVGPFGPGSALPALDGSAPDDGFTVKARTSSMVFHTPTSPFYERLLPQIWFRTPEDARRAGFTSWERTEVS